MRFKTVLTTTIASGIAIGCMVPAAMANAATLPATPAPQSTSSSTLYKGSTPRSQYMIKTEKDGKLEYYPTPLFAAEPFDNLPLEGSEPSTINLPDGAKQDLEIGYKQKDKPYAISVGLATTKAGDKEVIISGSWDKSPWKIAGGAIYNRSDSSDNKIKLSAEYLHGPFKIIESVGPSHGNGDYKITSAVKYVDGNWVIGGGWQSPLTAPYKVSGLLGGVAYKSGNASAYAQYTPEKKDKADKAISGGLSVGGTYKFAGATLDGSYNTVEGPKLSVNYEKDNANINVEYSLSKGMTVSGEIKDGENPNNSLKATYSNEDGLSVDGKVGSWDAKTDIKKIPVEVPDPQDSSKKTTIEVPAAVNVISYDGKLLGGSLKAGITGNFSFGKDAEKLQKDGKLHLGIAAGNISYEKGNYSGELAYSMKPSKITYDVPVANPPSGSGGAAQMGGGTTKKVIWEWTPNSSASFNYKNGTTVYGLTATQSSEASGDKLTVTDSIELKAANEGSSNSAAQGGSLTFSKDDIVTYSQPGDHVIEAHKETLSAEAKYNYGNWEFSGKETVNAENGKHENYVISASYKGNPVEVTAKYDQAHGFGISGQYKTENGTTFTGKYNERGVSGIGVKTTFAGAPISVDVNYSYNDGITFGGGIADSGWYFNGSF